jgi:hypothetical protein
MLTRMIFFAAGAADALPEHLANREPSKLFGLSLRDIALLVGVAGIIALALFLWAYLTRRERRRHLVRSAGIGHHAERAHVASRDERVRMRKRRREHPDNLRRNPTLGETGGLPPLRPDEPAQPAA